MSDVMTVEWKHVLLDPLVFQRYGTYRVARVPGGVNAFPTPVGGEGRWASGSRYWSPSLAGFAPPQYEYPDPAFEPEPKRRRTFNFRFWSLTEQQNGIDTTRRSIRGTNDFNASYGAGDILIKATAFYYWDFGSGPGGHAVYVDAFNETKQEFIPDDFVDVIPDNEKGSLTREANNGRLDTEPIEKPGVVIRARNPTGDNLIPMYQFNTWTNEQDLSRFGPETVPIIEGADIRVHQGSVISALAHYAEISPQIPVIDWPLGAWLILGKPVDGSIIVIPRGGGGPTPVGPWGSLSLATLLASAQPGQLLEQIADLQKSAQSGQLLTQIADLQKRIEALEKLR
jgi:hypothetical protein